MQVWDTRHASLRRSTNNKGPPMASLATGADDGSRTHLIGLGSRSSTDELHQHGDGSITQGNKKNKSGFHPFFAALFVCSALCLACRARADGGGEGAAFLRMPVLTKRRSGDYHIDHRMENTIEYSIVFSSKRYVWRRVMGSIMCALLTAMTIWQKASQFC